MAKNYLKYEMGKLREEDKVVRMSFQPTMYLSKEFNTAIVYLEIVDVLSEDENLHLAN